MNLGHLEHERRTKSYYTFPMIHSNRVRSYHESLVKYKKSQAKPSQAKPNQIKTEQTFRATPLTVSLTRYFPAGLYTGIRRASFPHKRVNRPTADQQQTNNRPRDKRACIDVCHKSAGRAANGLRGLIEQAVGLKPRSDHPANEPTNSQDSPDLSQGSPDLDRLKRCQLDKSTQKRRPVPPLPMPFKLLGNKLLGNQSKARQGKAPFGASARGVVARTSYM